MRWLKKKIRVWLELDDHQARLVDIETHFVTQRDDKGRPTQTLADVPVADRKHLKPNLAGATWQQRKAWLEATDGGRKLG